MIAPLPDTPAASLRRSAVVFERAGQQFSADLSRRMADDAETMPALYVHWARQQAERAEGVAS